MEEPKNTTVVLELPEPESGWDGRECIGNENKHNVSLSASIDAS